jgi:hypothetical protein
VKSMSRSFQRKLQPGVSWFLVLGVTAAILLVCLRVLVPPVPLNRDAPLELFSEARVRDTVHPLADGIGRRVNGTEGYAKAAEYLAKRLHEIPGVEVTPPPMMPPG